MQSRNIVRLDKYTMRNKTERETGVSFMSGELTFNMVYSGMRDIHGLRPMMDMADSFIDYMFEDVNRAIFYIHVNKYECSGDFKSIESKYYKDIKGKEERIMEQYNDNPYFYINEYFSEIGIDYGEEKWQSVKTELNKFLKRLGFKVGTVGEKHFSYYVSDVKNSDIFIQDLYYDENFCNAIVIDETTGEENVCVKGFYLNRNMSFTDVIQMIIDSMPYGRTAFKRTGRVFLVDNYFAEQFDNVSKVREVITKEYLLLRED